MAGLLLAAVAFAGGCARPAEPTRLLRVGTSGDYAPFSFAASGAPQGLDGFDLAVARAYAAARGLDLVLVRFRWEELLDALAEQRFDLAMSGVTVRPERSLAGRFSAPLVESGAVVLVKPAAGPSDLGALDRRGVRIAVNAGGHLERVARLRFPRAALLPLSENAAVPEALLAGIADAAVSDTLEAPRWQRLGGGLRVLGPFTRDRKAYLVRPELPALAADLDAFLLASEADGTLPALRARWFPGAETAATATPLGALFAAIDERLSLMPLVAEAKRASGRPIADPAQEERVLASAVAATRQAARQAGRPAPDPARVRAAFAAQLAAARGLQTRLLAHAPAPGAAPAPDLDTRLRPALLRLGERIAVALVAAGGPVRDVEVRRAAREALRSPGLETREIDAIAEAVARCLDGMREAPGTARRSQAEPRVASLASSPARTGNTREIAKRNAAKRAPRIGTSQAIRRCSASSDQPVT